MHGIGLASTVAGGTHSLLGPRGSKRDADGWWRRPGSPGGVGASVVCPGLRGAGLMEPAYEPEAGSRTVRIGSEPSTARARACRKSSPPLPRGLKSSRSVPRSACHLTHRRARTVPGLSQKQLPRVIRRKGRSIPRVSTPCEMHPAWGTAQVAISNKGGSLRSDPLRGRPTCLYLDRYS